MSKLSKSKRDKRKKQQPKRPFARLSDQQQVQNHAVLTNEEGQVVAAIGLQGRQWLLSIGGQTMGNADDPMPMLAMLKHLANVQGKEGRKVDLQYSDGLGELIKVMAAEKDLDADAYLDELAAEFDTIDAEDAEAAEATAEGDADAAAADASTDAVDVEADAAVDSDADTDDKPKA